MLRKRKHWIEARNKARFVAVVIEFETVVMVKFSNLIALRNVMLRQKSNKKTNNVKKKN